MTAGETCSMICLALTHDQIGNYWLITLGTDVAIVVVLFHQHAVNAVNILRHTVIAVLLQ